MDPALTGMFGGWAWSEGGAWASSDHRPDSSSRVPHRPGQGADEGDHLRYEAAQDEQARERPVCKLPGQRPTVVVLQSSGGPAEVRADNPQEHAEGDRSGRSGRDLTRRRDSRSRNRR